MAHAPGLDALSGRSLRRLHRRAVAGDALRALLERAQREGVVLDSGVDRRSDPRTARILALRDDELWLDAPRLRAEGRPQIYLHFDLDRTRYFFAAPPIAGGGGEPLRLELPLAIYEAERRELLREAAPPEPDAPRVRLANGGDPVEARLRDWSYQGMAVALPDTAADRLRGALRVEVLEGERAGVEGFARIRHRRRDVRPAWTQLGLEVSAVEPRAPFPVESREQILEGGVAQRAWRRFSLASAVAKRFPAKLPGVRPAPTLETVTYTNAHGHFIAGLLDRALGGRGGTAVVIPPAWGRTKESFVPLARTLVSTFRSAGEPLSVLRFDGTNRRGESHIDAECRAPGDEYLHFRFSHAVDDIRASFDFLRDEVAPERIVLVSFSLGAVEGRRALVLEGTDDLAGWVSVVGMVDLQSGLRTVSGGIDFAYGQSMGVHFGRHELVGVVADMDLTGLDAFQHDLVFLEDARRDMAKLQLPVTWIHGRYDAWMDLERVRQLMAAGPAEGRRLIEVPAGHQMRSSREALETFQLVSREVARMALGREVDAPIPDLSDLARRTEAERARRPAPTLDRRGFWADYLLGRDRRLGFELMSATSAYRALMRRQIEQLALEAGQHVVDLGGGTGDFPLLLAELGAPPALKVTELDLVPDALRRGARRLADGGAVGFPVRRVAADLELDGCAIPLAEGCAQRVLASLVLSYVDDPAALLAGIRDLLEPGGRLVLSSMRRDADISRIYVQSMAELPPDRRRRHFGASSEDFEQLQRVFLNDAARLMQLEEEGRFRFYDEEELEALAEDAGLEPLDTQRAFGEPPQAVILTARRPA